MSHHRFSNWYCLLNWYSQSESAADLDSAFKRFFELCAKAKTENCAWAISGQSGDQLTQKFDDFLDKVTAVQSNAIRDAFFNILYKPAEFRDFAKTLQGWYDAPSTIPGSNTADKDGKQKRDTFEPTTFETLKTPLAISGISCSDRITKLQGSADNFKKWLGEYRLVTKYGYDLASAGDLRCSVWQTTAKERFDVPESGIDTANPILYVNTPYDPVTPMISADNSAKSFLKSGVLKSSGLGVSIDTVVNCND